MTRNFHNTVRIRPTQSGSTLIVAIVLLLILTIFSLAAVRIGVSEQRTSGNDFKARLTRQIAEGGISHGRATLSLLDARIRPNAGQAVNAAMWQLCQRNDTSFPCGAEPDPARRALMYRFIGGSDLNGDGTTTVYEQRSLPVTTVAAGQNFFVEQAGSATAANAFPVEYAVGALMCRIDLEANPGAQNIGCTTNSNAAENNALYTLVSRAQMPGEAGASTIVTTVSIAPTIAVNTRIPPVLASGILEGLGNGSIVGNPNATGDGSGVFLSIWSRQDFDSSAGSWQTCQRDEFFRNSPAVFYDDDTSDDLPAMPVCGAVPQCGCPGPDAGDASGGGMPRGSEEGIDVLDVDNNNGALPDSTYFPCDLFGFVLGTAPVRDDADGDGFCEQGVDEDGDNINDRVQAFMDANSAQILNCSELGPDSSGLIWIRQNPDGTPIDCPIPRGDIGQPSHPVILVVDGPFNSSAGMRVFGLVFARDPAIYLDPRTGGASGFNPGGGNSEVYGSVVVEGGGKINGTTDIIYSLDKMAPPSQNSFPQSVEVPGAWTDQYSF